MSNFANFTHFKSLHWLPVKARGTYKVACLCCHCHSSTAPLYVNGMLQKIVSHSLHLTHHLLNRSAHEKLTFGGQSFSFASVSNSIPNNLLCPNNCHLVSFKDMHLSFSLPRPSCLFDLAMYVHSLVVLLIFFVSSFFL